jgi:class 3 adenylate cyclase
LCAESWLRHATLLKPTSKFIEECVISLAASTESTSPSSSQAQPTALDIRVKREQSATDRIDGERETVMAAFADIKGWTELTEDLDPEEARTI